MFDTEGLLDTWAHEGEPTAKAWPGRRTLTQALVPRPPDVRAATEARAGAVQLRAAPTADLGALLDEALGFVAPSQPGGAVQRRADGDAGTAPAPLAVAAAGVDGATEPLPHGHIIQRHFGRHDVGAVRTRTGGAAASASAALGARAYATGDAIGFRSAPDLHTAAHEAAHVVQQRRGVALAGGVGAAGDRYEQHADRVADLVVAGRSAEAALDELAGAGGGPAVQRQDDDGPSDEATAVAGAMTAGAASGGADGAGPAPTGARRVAHLFDGKTEDKRLAAAEKKIDKARKSNTTFRIDWARKLQSLMRVDHAMTSSDGTLDDDTIAGVMLFQDRAGVGVDGVVGGTTRSALEAAYPELASPMVGDHLEERVLVPGEASTEERYAYYRGIIEGAGGVFLAAPMQLNLLGIRGVSVIGDPPEVAQTGSAADFAGARAAEIAHDATTAVAETIAAATGTTAVDIPDPERSSHFSGSEGAGSTGAARYDDLFVSLWVDADGAVHVSERVGSVDPNLTWSTDKDQSDPKTEGTSHLRDGQYAYKLGTHNTSHHPQTIRDAYGEPTDQDGEPRDSAVTIHGDTGERVRYDALVPAGDVEVWRDDVADDDHYPTMAEEDHAAEVIDDPKHDQHDRYTDGSDIALNMHSSPDDMPSSLACQVIPVGNDYEGFIREVKETKEASGQEQIYYTLIDASKIDAGLTLVRTEPLDGGGATPVP